jgi:drug/metabolite transporter (DMT)-like permease
MNVNNRGTRADWLVFVALGFFWGSSYLFIKIGVEAGLTPFTLVALRLLVGSLLLGTVVAVARERPPRDPAMYGRIAILAFFAIALPFVLITVAEEQVPSSLAATLTAPVPLFAILFAAALLAERITIAKIVGIAVGLVGVAILMGFDVAQLGQTDVTPQLILVAAAVSYGFGGVFARRYVTGLRPMVTAFVEVTTAMLMAAACALLFENPIQLITTIQLPALEAVIWLGLFGSGLAYLAFFRLINAWGPTRTALVAYLLPVWGIALGFVILNEPIQPGLVLGTALVIGGIAFVNVDRHTVSAGASRLRSRFRDTPESTPTNVPDGVAGPR